VINGRIATIEDVAYGCAIHLGRSVSVLDKEDWGLCSVVDPANVHILGAKHDVKIQVSKRAVVIGPFVMIDDPNW